MSYNYDQCVQSIQEHRRRAHKGTSTPDLEALQGSMDGFAALSKHCPMTPLLWMQYAHDTEALVEGLTMSDKHEQRPPRLQQMEARISALETSRGILELALAEFPGCALLHLYHLESLADCVYHNEEIRQLNAQSGADSMDLDDRQIAVDRCHVAFELARQSVGRGTHVNEGMIVSAIYRLRGYLLLYCFSLLVEDFKSGASNTDGMDKINDMLQQLSALFQTWSTTPIASNDDLMQDLEYLWDEACVLLLSLHGEERQILKRKQELEKEKVALWAKIDGERKKTSSRMNILSSRENEVDNAMSNEGITLPRELLLPHEADEKTGDSDGTDPCRHHAQPLKRESTKWNNLLLLDTVRFLVGLGGSETSRAFSKYASVLQRNYHDTSKKGRAINNGHSILQEHVDISFIASMYERALSECPTIESLWVSYNAFLTREWYRLKNERQQPEAQQQQHADSQQQLKDLATTLESVSYRAIRNCPYSSSLFEIRMTTLGLTSVSNLEPDDIIAVTQEATDMGFLDNDRETMLHLRLVAVRVVKRRLLSLVSLGTTATRNGSGKDYDQDEEIDGLSIAKHKKKPILVTYRSPSDVVMEEATDLVEDIRDMYDGIDNFLFKSHPTWSEGKSSYWTHRALTEAYVLCPICRALKKRSGKDDNLTTKDTPAGDTEAIRCFEKLIKSEKPSHPDSWRVYIRYCNASHLYFVLDDSNSEQSQPSGIASVASTIRRTRRLYHRAMSSVRKAGQEANKTVDNKDSWKGGRIDDAMLHRDYDSALSDLCREYLDFEQTSGSEESLLNAQTLVHNKMADWNPLTTLATPATDNLQDAHGKRKLTMDNTTSSHQKAPTTMTDTCSQHNEEEDDTQAKPKRPKVKTNLKQPKKQDGLHKIRIGKMLYPAHPFTIHVSNLSKETQDMDLVDAFLPNFGAIVHAKIMREKHFGRGQGESKCCGLIQFENKMSVEQAVQEDSKIKVGEKLVKIQRSHTPAVGIVPPGMHRVKPKGEGKMSKRNKLKKESKTKTDSRVMEVEAKEKTTEVKGDQTKKSNSLTSPSSISLGALSFKPRGVRKKPKLMLEITKKQE